MLDYQSSFAEKEELREAFLSRLGGKNFTDREVDVIACALHNRGEKKTASILNISPRTVSSHVYNVMNKLGCNSREQIIDFVEKNGASNHYRRYYFCLQIYAEFQHFMQKIGKKNRHRKQYIIIEHDNSPSELYKHLKSDLQKAGIEIVKDKSETIQEDVKDYSEWYASLEQKNYYSHLLGLIKKIYDPISILEMVEEFEGGAKNIFTQMEGVNVVNVQDGDLSKQSGIFKRTNLNIAVLMIGISIASVFCYVYMNLYVTSGSEVKALGQNDVKIKQLNERLLDLISKVSANNVIEKYAKANHSHITVLEQQVEIVKEPEVQGYFYGKHVTAQELANCLYNINSLTAYQLYVERDGDKAREGLFLAKKLAEHFVISRSKVKFEIEEMSPADIFNEFQIAAHLSEIYTLTTYLLGRSYLYQGDFRKAAPYLEVANYFGEKLDLFEGYLARFQGLNRIREREILSLLENKEYAKANALIKELISSYEMELVNEKTYYTNINHLVPEFVIELVPYKDKLNRVICLKQIIKFCAQLMIIDNSFEVRKKYLAKIIRYSSGEDGILRLIHAKEVVSKHRIVALNCLAEILLAMEHHKIDSEELCYLTAKNLNISYNGDRLSLIESMYIMAQEMSRSGEYTKTDALNGMVRLLDLKMQVRDLSTAEKEEIQKRQESYKAKVSELNSKLKHRHQDMLIYKE